LIPFNSILPKIKNRDDKKQQRQQNKTKIAIIREPKGVKSKDIK
jgi:hypothetical protein